MKTLASLLLLWAALPAAAELASPADSRSTAVATASLVAQVTTEEGVPAADAQIRLIGTPRYAVADAEGRCRFDALPAGRYVVEATSPRYGQVVASVELAAGQQLEIELRVDLAVHRDEISVTASARPRAVDELMAPVAVLADRELLVAARATLGETLAAEPGVHQTFFGAGASRPVIRGLGGDRIRVLESGLGTGDASTTSPDHAVAFDPLAADQVEIVRGPATLLYGSSAIGGVVNLIDRTVPSYVPEEPISGSVTLQAGSAADSSAGSLELTGGGGHLAWHLEAYRRDDGDYESGAGEVENSYVEGRGGGAGFSYVGSDGYLGVGFGRFETTYGNPGEPDAGVYVDMESDRWDVAGSLQRSFGPFRGLELRLGGTDYQHREIEGGEVGTLFLNDSLEARVQMPHRTIGVFTGMVGAQYSEREFSALGAEAFAPPSRAESTALFLLEETGGERLRFQFGARYERQQNRAEPFAGREDEENPDPPDRTFSGVSSSIGLLWTPLDGYGLAASLSRSVKLPNSEELYSNGPHLATGAYEIGDPTLEEETSLGLDLSLRKSSGRLTGSLTLFANRFDDFIFEDFTGELAGGEDEEGEALHVIRYEQRDADFRGAELEVHFELLHEHPHHLELELLGDYVHAEDRTTGHPLPRIPPLRYGLGLRYGGERWLGHVRVQRVEEQDRVGEFETATAGYHQLDAAVGYRFFAGGTVHDLLLAGSNLTDEVARNHVSYLKDLALLPGRDVRLTYRLSF